MVRTVTYVGPLGAVELGVNGQLVVVRHGESLVLEDDADAEQLLAQPDNWREDGADEAPADEAPAAKRRRREG